MKTKHLVIVLIIGLLITACGASPTPAEPTPDVAAVRTSAAQTVVAQFTLTAAVFTATVRPSALSIGPFTGQALIVHPSSWTGRDSVHVPPIRRVT